MVNTNNFDIDKFLKFEEDNNQFDKQYNGIYYWQYIRYYVFTDLFRLKNKGEYPHTQFSDFKKLKRFKIFLKGLIWSIIKNPFLFRGKVDLLVFNQQRRIRKGEKYFDPQFDIWLHNQKEFKYLIMEGTYYGNHFPAYNPNNMRFLDFFIEIRKVLRALIKKNLSGLVKEINEIINSEFQLEINPRQLEFQLKTLYIEYKYLKPLYKRLLKKFYPKAILINCYYNISKMIFIEIARELSIKTIEFQHGTMGEYHLAYNFPENIKIDTFPQFVFVWGQFWKDTTRFPVAKDRVMVTGYPYYEKRVKEEKEKAKEMEKIKPVILFISQGTIGKKLSKLAVKLANKVSKEYDIIYKLHPGEYYQWEKNYSWLIDADIEVIDTNELDIYQIFAKADIQIGVYSTALFEGLGFGLKTIIMKYPNYTMMGNLLENSLVVLCRDLDEVLKELSNKEQSIIKADYFIRSSKSEQLINDSLNSVINGNTRIG